MIGFGQTRLGNPAILFALLSLLFGGAAIILNPPLGGPDEGAHFLRIYSITQGEIVPHRTDARGRRGLMLPEHINDDVSAFELARQQLAASETTLPQVMRKFSQERANAPPREPRSVFVPYGGSEAYSPAPYLPYLVVGIPARLLGLEFLTSLYLLRVAGLIAFTAIAALAIALTPRFSWAFFAIALLPGAIYSRSVLSADGTALSTTLMLTALCVRAALTNQVRGSTERAIWMAWCVLTKPAQTAFILLEGMTASVREHLRRLPALALIILPGLLLTGWWLLAASADVGSWRVEGSGNSARDFDPVWKLQFLAANPLHFAKVALQSLDYSVELWRQSIGVLGWLDTRLLPVMYPVLALLLLTACLEQAQASPAIRVRIAFWCTGSALGYTIAIFLIFFLAFTPLDSDRVLGIQGRYFMVVFPPLAVLFAVLLPRDFPARVRRGCAIAGALLGGGAMIEAILRVNW
jgi:uncharacterized membrane protein